MDIFSSVKIKELLSKYETKPSKGLGQNFLINENILNKILEAADLKTTDTVLEVGPGIGTLTQKLAERGGKIIAIEKDKKMVNILTDVLNDLGVQNVQIVNEDILNYKIQTTNYKLIANIPYYITAPLIRFFLENKNPPKEIVLMMQKEVAQRICSNPPNMSLLAVSVQFYAKAEIISYVSKNCFWPAPKIDSAIIKIIPQKNYDVSPDLFFKVVKAGFSQPRKQLAGNLSKILKISKEETTTWLTKNNIKPTQRAETLSVDDWKNLTKTGAC